MLVEQDIDDAPVHGLDYVRVVSAFQHDPHALHLELVGPLDIVIHVADVPFLAKNDERVKHLLPLAIVRRLQVGLERFLRRDAVLHGVLDLLHRGPFLLVCDLDEDAVRVRHDETAEAGLKLVVRRRQVVHIAPVRHRFDLANRMSGRAGAPEVGGVEQHVAYDEILGGDLGSVRAQEGVIVGHAHYRRFRRHPHDGFVHSQLVPDDAVHFGPSFVRPNLHADQLARFFGLTPLLLAPHPAYPKECRDGLESLERGVGSVDPQ